MFDHTATVYKKIQSLYNLPEFSYIFDLMPNLQASIKDLRQSKKRTANNNRIRRRLKDSVKSYKKAIESGDAKTAEENLPRAQKMLDKAAKRGIIKKGTASRKKSLLSKKLNDLTAPDVKVTK
ncbi:30S ribosomal protein S20 [Candidatus Nomurabacteria bacterium]|uniref:Small ribosomal subunit protein bS20 n=1 Tax=Candidatus Dojkabacteria bacterium TaxID=2099670 RepID=A0A955KXI1_9BACT|nr:30S ribosomal protein S20 [Candidatus Dojkabacteria bacterium]MCB9789665.1 30S ribosomal protein S20 [Candidatus Nomurabacteria bacterium]MCB9803994.1 30S ribosomal protein S20 [Candidatus Nomurabacteria bacterium]